MTSKENEDLKADIRYVQHSWVIITKYQNLQYAIQKL